MKFLDIIGIHKFQSYTKYKLSYVSLKYGKHHIYPIFTVLSIHFLNTFGNYVADFLEIFNANSINYFGLEN